jgi:hypothetical protein
MAQQANPATRVTCSVCKTEAVAISGTFHRRCPGKEGAKIRAKHTQHQKYGTWQ